MRRRWATGSGRAAGPLIALALVACGGGGAPDGARWPDGAVATIDGTPVSRQDADRAETWQAIAATEGVTEKPIARTTPPRLLRFAGTPDACARELSAVDARPAVATLSNEGRRAYCERARLDIREFAVGSLLAEHVTAAEAAKAGVAASERDVDGVLEAAIEALGGRKRLGTYLGLTGLDEQDLRERARDQALTARLREAVVKREAAKVTEADVRRYFAQRRTRLVTPERRDVRLVVTRRRADADAARRALAAGQPLATVARRYSVDRVSRRGGGRLTAVVEDALPPELGAAVFAAPPGRLRGPIAGDGLHYVLRVDRITPSRPLEYAAVRADLRRELRNPYRIWDEWQRRVTARWKPRIACAPGYAVVELCRNRGPRIERPAVPLRAESTRAAPSG